MAGPDSRRQESDLLRVEERWSWSGAPEIGDDVMSALSRMHQSDEHDGVPDEEVAARLRKYAAHIAEVAGDPGTGYSLSLRWSLFNLLADLQAPEAVDGLVKEATRRLPEGDPTDGACLRPEDFEPLVPVMAVEAIERLGRVDPTVAERALREVVASQSNTAVRRAAVHALLRLAPTAREEVAAMLPEHQRFILTRQVVAPTLVNAPADPGRSKMARRVAGGAPRLVLDSEAPRITPERG